MDVVAIILDMDTPGGEVTASDELHREVLRCRDAGKPVVTCMRAMGASGGYFIAAGSDWIVANRLTMTGSVGVIISTLNYKELFAKVGLDSEVYRSGDMKDMLNGARARRPDEMQYVQQLVNETFREFADVVAAGRERYETADDVINSSFGDGRILSGTHAAELGLVDQIGYFEDAVAKARELAGVFDAKVVRYRRALKLTDILFSMKAQKSLELRSVLPEEARSMKTGRMYFLAPTVAP
jgi:protease-4